MLIKLIEVQRGIRGGTATLKEIYLNPHHIISVRDDTLSNQSLVSEALSLGLSQSVVFSTVTVHEGTVPRSLTIVGAPSEIYSKIKKNWPDTGKTCANEPRGDQGEGGKG